MNYGATRSATISTPTNLDPSQQGMLLAKFRVTYGDYGRWRSMSTLPTSNVNSIIESDRKFSVFSYGASHGLLLLRSGKEGGHTTRIDILIQDVRAMEIRSWFQGLKITEVGQEYLGGFRSNPIEMIELGSRVYAVRGHGWSGFVVGGIVSVREDDRDFMAPSLLLPSGLSHLA